MDVAKKNLQHGFSSGAGRGLWGAARFFAYFWWRSPKDGGCREKVS